MSRRLAAHVAVGDGAAQELAAWTGVPVESIRVIHNGVPDPGAAGDPPQRGHCLAGALGRLVPEKGFDVLLAALREVPGLELVVVGDGPERAHLEDLADVPELHGRVRFTGGVADAAALMGSLDLVVQPSRSEGFPLVIIEAMLAGLPVVATDVGAVREAVLDEVTGLIVQPDDPTGLAAALRRLAANGEACRAIGAAGRAHALERFTAPRMVEAYERLFAELVH